MDDRTLVIGGGLLGLATAHALLTRGEPIEVLEREDDVGQGASHANGALLHASMPSPWNAPGVHLQLARMLFDPASPMKLRPLALPGLLTWGISFLRNSRPGTFRSATAANYRLAAYSVGLTRGILDRLELDCDRAETGSMKLFHDEASLAGALAIARMLEPLGLRFRVLDRAAAVAVEPQLSASRQRIFGGLRFEDDFVCDPYAFCRGLSAEIARLGGRVRTGVTVRRLVRTGRGLEAHLDNGERLPARRMVVAAGSWTEPLLRSAGASIAVRPAKGYSLTIEAAPGVETPKVPIVDGNLNVAITPLGRRCRIVGVAEFAGYDLRVRASQIDHLSAIFRTIYPEVAARCPLDQGRRWAGLRPLSADGRPFVGATSVEGLFVNSGHGQLGWTMAVGSGALLADLALGRPPEIDPLPYRATRGR